ncbi:MAG: SDR family oxidoreductase [Pirellulaceae bacterium]
MPESKVSLRPVVVVTGSSTGIGRATAIELANQGWDVVIHGQTKSKDLLATEAAIRATGSDVHIAECKFSPSTEWSQYVEHCWGWRGRVNAWCNLAGADILTTAARKAPFSEKLELLWNVDVLATLQLSRHIATRFRGNENACDQVPSVINMGWDQAFQGMEGDAGQLFGTTKGAVMCATKSLAAEFSPHVRFNCVAPGWIKTDWGDSSSEKWQQRAVDESLMKRWGSADDVASTIAFLLQPAASFINGQVINVNGGFDFGRVK